MTVKTQQICYNLLLKGYMFQLLRVIIRPSNEPSSTRYWNKSTLPLQCNQAYSHHHIKLPRKIRTLLVSRK